MEAYDCFQELKKYAKDFKMEFVFENCRVSELGGNLVLSEYRGNGITTKLQITGNIEKSKKRIEKAFKLWVIK